MKPATSSDPARVLLPLHNNTSTPRLRLLLVVALVAGLSACTSMNFYTQAIAGQFELWRKAEPIAEVLKNPALSAATQKKLALVVAARQFAHQHLQLPDNGSYRDYVELGRDYVVWNVFVAPELSLQPLESCFLFAGCLSYRGYFSRADAEQFAQTWRDQGMDVYVGGVAAYSTLGWFSDPVLSSMMDWQDFRIAEILFHELAHQQLYVKDDTTFNESFAVAIASAGVETFLARRGQNADEAKLWREREDALTDLLLETRAELEKTFNSTLSDSAKRAAKQAVFVTLQQRYDNLKARWDNDSRFDRWMQLPWNNARLSSIATYHELVPAFRALLKALDHDYKKVYAVLEEIAALAPDARHACLLSLDVEDQALGCPTALNAAIDPSW